MRIVDATARLVRAPEVCFAAVRDRSRRVRPQHREPPSGRGAAGPRGHACRRCSGSRMNAIAVDIGDDGATVTLRIRRQVTRAPCHRRRRPPFDLSHRSRHRYRQPRLSADRAHLQSRPCRPHRDTSTEFHTESGPFTFVPLPGDRSSLVWVVEPAEAERIAALDDAALAGEIEQRCHSMLGKIAVEPGRGMFPLAIETARNFAPTPRRADRRGRPSSFRRSARRASISACAMPPRSARSWCRRAARAATSALPRFWRATTASAAPT